MSDVDTALTEDQQRFTAQTEVGRYGTFALGEDGEWTYTLDNADPVTDALGAGQKVTDTFDGRERGRHDGAGGGHGDGCGRRSGD